MEGVGEWINSTAESVKRNSPDITPVTEAWWKGYDVGVAKARDLHVYLSDDQVHDNLTRIAKQVAKNGAICLARSSVVGAGPIIDIVSRSVQCDTVDSQKERIKALETRVAIIEEELTSMKIVQQGENPKASINMASKSENEPDFCANVNQKPEDVLQTFMVKQFVGTKLLDDLIVPGTGHRREKPITSLDGHHE